jgi:hypothetical protein
MRSRSGSARSSARFRVIATAPMLPRVGPLSGAWEAGSARARPVLRQPAMDRPGNSRPLLRHVDASRCQSLLRHPGQRRVRAPARAHEIRVNAAAIDVALTCRCVAAAEHLATLETAVRGGATTRSRRANDTRTGANDMRLRSAAVRDDPRAAGSGTVRLRATRRAGCRVVMPEPSIDTPACERGRGLHPASPIPDRPMEERRNDATSVPPQTDRERSGRSMAVPWARRGPRPGPARARHA